jgi:hypothetical protein
MQKIRVGGVDYDIILQPEVYGEDGAKLHAKIGYFPEFEISLNSNNSDQVMAIALWHEVIHGLLRSSARDDDVSEDAIDSLAQGIYQVLRDNPWMANISDILGEFNE